MRILNKEEINEMRIKILDSLQNLPPDPKKLENLKQSLRSVSPLSITAILRNREFSETKYPTILAEIIIDSINPDISSEEIYSYFRRLLVCFKLNKELIFNVLQKGLHGFKKPDYIHQFISSHKKLSFYVKDLFISPTLSYKQKTELLKGLLNYAILNKNALLLKELEAIFQDSPGYQSLKDKLHSDQLDILEQLINYSDTDYITDRMLELIPGQGSISYEGGLLCVSEMTSRKKFDVNTTVLRQDEFFEYIGILRKANYPLREKFISVTSHWIAGEILINEEGIAKLFIIDSLGFEIVDGHLKVYDETAGIINEFIDFFPSPPSTIYFDPIKRQRSRNECWLFALDDIRHLQTLESYLPNPGQCNTLFDYLEQNRQNTLALKATDSEDEAFNVNITVTNLPISLIRTTQSRKLLTDYIPQRSEIEQKMSINKRGYTALFSSQAGFVTDPTTGIFRNKRLELKMRDMKEHNYQYLIKRPYELTISDCQLFSLEGFKERQAALNMSSKQVAKSI